MDEEDDRLATPSLWSPGELLSDGGAEQWEGRGGVSREEGGGASTPRLCRPRRERWGPWQGAGREALEEAEDREREKESEWEGVLESWRGCGSPFLGAEGGDPNPPGVSGSLGEGVERGGEFGGIEAGWGGVEGIRQLSRPPSPVSELSNREQGGGRGEEGGAGGGWGAAGGLPTRGSLALLGGGVIVGVTVDRIGWVPRRRGLRRRVISCSSLLSWETCWDRLLICRRTQEGEIQIWV